MGPPNPCDDAVTGTILVIEDEDTLRISVCKMLRRLGFSVLEASDGHTALDLVESHGDDIAAVLLDLTLPGLSGPKVLERIREVRPLIKIILTSAYPRAAAIAAVGTLSSVSFIRKPYRAQELAALIRSILSSEPQH